MTRENVEKITNTIKNGRFVRVEYETEVKTSKLARDNAVSILKQTTLTGRIGCKYTNLKLYKQQHQDGEPTESTREDWGHYEVANRIKVHNTTGQSYLALATMKNAAPKTNYVLIDGNKKMDVTKEQLMASGYVQPSYWNKSETPIILIKTDNIKTINRKKE